MDIMRLLRFMSLGSCLFMLYSCGVSSLSSSPFAWETASTFVTVDPHKSNRLSLNGEEFRFSGFNSTSMFESQEAADEQFGKMKDLGSNALRIWGFWNGDVEGLQPELNVYNEETWKKLDYVVATAARYEIKLIVALANYWDEYGGISTWNDWAGLGKEQDLADEKEAFYTDETTRGLYKTYVYDMLHRSNTITGVRYKDDPTIMMWEPINEARGRSDPSGKTVRDWLAWSSAYIKELAPQQLVGSGAEGFFGSHPVYGYYPWQAAQPPAVTNPDGSDAGLVAEGSYVDMICAIETIDLCSIHAWPDHWYIDPKVKPEDFMSQWIDAHIETANATYKKPLYLGEFGWGIDREADNAGMDIRNRVFEKSLFKAYEADRVADIRDDLVGVAIWNLVKGGESARARSSYYVTCPDDEESCTLIRKFNEVQLKKAEDQAIF